MAMTDVAAISGAITALKSAFELSKALIGVRDLATIQSKVIELQGQILAAQSSALAAQENQSTLLQLVSKLEKEVTDLKAWDAEKQRYQLQEVGHRGAVTYRLKQACVNAGEQVHDLCTNCYKDGFKSILQREVRTPNLSEVLVCPDCKAEFYLTGERDPRHASPAKSTGRRPRPQN